MELVTMLVMLAILATAWLVRKKSRAFDPSKNLHCFTVPNRRTLDVVVFILSKFSPLSEACSFRFQDTVQTLMSDKSTLIISYENVNGSEPTENNPYLNAIVICTDEPGRVMRDIMAILERNDLRPKVDGSRITSPCFLGWCLKIDTPHTYTGIQTSKLCKI